MHNFNTKEGKKYRGKYGKDCSIKDFFINVCFGDYMLIPFEWVKTDEGTDYWNKLYEKWTHEYKRK